MGFGGGIDIKDDSKPGAEGASAHGGTERKLEARHIQMIAIGGTIGTGLFLASSQVIAAAGALGALIAYIIAGISVFFVCASLGEMATLIPITGSFSAYASRFVDPALGFTLGWNYWLLWIIALPLELLACSKFLNFWLKDVSPYLLMAIILVVLVAINCMAVKGFGEIEYWLAMIKVCAIVLFLFVSIYVLIRDKPGFDNYTEAGGPFLGRDSTSAFVKTVEVLIGACMAFGGTEMVGVTAGEAKNPRSSVPKAINGTFWRIMIFYVATIFLLGLMLPANLEAFKNNESIASSPFVLALELGKIPGTSHVMNFVCFIAVFSAANSSVYASSRALYGLAQQRRAPAFLKVTKRGVPLYGIIVTVCLSSVVFAGKFVGAGVVFDWLTKLVSICIVITWMFINITHLRFRKAYVAQGYRIEDLPYKALFFPYGAYWGIFVCLIVIVLNPIFSFISAQADPKKNAVMELLSNCISLPLYLVMFLGFKLSQKTKLVPLLEADIRSGNINIYPELEGLGDEEVDLTKKKGKFAKALAFLA